MTEHHRILVTGASGFVGRWLLNAFSAIQSDREIEVVSAGRGQNCDIDFDVSDKLAVSKVVRDLRPTAIVHLAAIAAPQDARRDPTQAWTVNFQGTLNLATAVLSEAPQCRFVFAGSSEVYGRSFAERDGGAVDEDTPLKPMTVYGATKAAADVALGQMYFDGLKSVRFRPFNHSGPGQSEAYVIPAFAFQIARIQAGLTPPIIEVGNLNAYRDFLDVRDVVRAYVIAAIEKADDAVGRVFNLSSGTSVQVGDILTSMIRSSGEEIEVVVAPDRVRPVEIPVASGNPCLANRVLGWTPQITLEATIRDVLSDCRERIHAEN